MKELKAPFCLNDICRFTVVARDANIKFSKNDDATKENSITPYKLADIDQYVGNLNKTLQAYSNIQGEECNKSDLTKEVENFKKFFATIDINVNWLQRRNPRDGREKYAFDQKEFVFLCIMLQEQNAAQSIWKKIRFSMNGKHQNYTLSLDEMKEYLTIVDMIEEMLRKADLPLEDIEEHVMHLHEQVGYEKLLTENLYRMLEWQISVDNSSNSLWRKNLSPVRKSFLQEDRILWLKWIYYNLLSYTHLVALKLQVLRQDDFDNIDKANREYIRDKLALAENEQTDIGEETSDTVSRWEGSAEDLYCDIFVENAIRQEGCEIASKIDRENMAFAREAYRNICMGYSDLAGLVDQFEDTRKEFSKKGRQRIAENMKKRMNFVKQEGGTFEDISSRYIGASSRELLDLVLADIPLNPELSFVK